MNNSKGLIFFVPLLLIACSSVPPQSKQQQGVNKEQQSAQKSVNSPDTSSVVKMDEVSDAVSAPKAVLGL